MAAPRNLDELEASFRALEAALPAIILHQTEVAALDITALTDQRLTETGKDADGLNFSPYTPAYKARKVKLGRDVGFVNFNLTGQMLASIGVTLKESDGVNAVVVIAPRDEETKKKAEGNDKHRKGFLNPSKEEVKRVEAIRAKRIEDMIREEYFQ